MANLNERFWEVDLIRGIALIGIVIFNWFYALKFLNIYTFEGGPLFWSLVPILTAGTFIALVGLSLNLSYSRVVKKYNKKNFLKKYFSRGLKIFSLGLLITFVTWYFMGEGFVYFGILHLIGLSIILAYPFVRYVDNIISIYTVGILIFLSGALLQTIRFDFNWLLWLGFTPEGFYSVDYFPVFPWFGLVLIGLAIGKTYYPNYERNFDEPRDPYKIEKYLSILGRHTLKVYMIHQPVLFVILYLLGYNLF